MADLMLLKYELKKIFYRKLNIVSMLGGLVILMLCIIMLLNDEWYEGGVEELTGIEAVKAQWEFSKSQADYLTDDFVSAKLREIKTSGINIESDDGYVDLIKPNGELLYFLARSYTDISDSGNYSMGILNNIDTSASFYESRMELINQHLNKDFSFGNYTDKEKEYWLNKAEKVTVPYKWGDKTIPNLILTIIALSFYEFFVIAICLSSLFAGEKETGADQILFASKLGKGCLIYSKIAAAFVFSIGYVSFCTVIGIGIIGGIFGFESLKLPVQILDAKIPYNLTFMQTIILQMVVTLAITLFVSAFVSVLSAVTRNSLATMVIALVWLIGPAFISGSKTNGLFNHINYLFAVRFIEVKNVLGYYIDYRVGNLVIDYVTMGIVVHLALAVGFTLVIKKIAIANMTQGHWL